MHGDSISHKAEERPNGDEESTIKTMLKEEDDLSFK